MVLTVLTVKVTVLSDVMSCSLLDTDQHFRVMCHLQLQCKVYLYVLIFENGGSRVIRMFEPIYKTAFCHTQKVVILIYYIVY